MQASYRERVTVEIVDDIARVTLTRADRMNGLDAEMLYALVEVAQDLAVNRAVRAVILHGDGKAFCSGLDFKSMTQSKATLLRAFLRRRRASTNLFQEAAWCWRRLPIPVIAVLHGYCYGGGLQIALAADFRYATPDCELSVMEVKWGLIPDMTGTVSLRTLVGIDVAKELTMTGRVFDGREAKALGLVTGIADDPMAAAHALATQIRARSPDAVCAAKALFEQTANVAEAKAFAVERGVQRKLLFKANQREAMRANFEKRAPHFAPRRVKF